MESQENEKQARAKSFKASFAQLQVDVAKHEKNREMLKALKQLCEGFGISVPEIKKVWYSSESPMEEIRESYSSLSCVHHFTAKKVGKVKDLLRTDIGESSLWKFFKERVRECGTPIIVFRVKSNGLWVLTNYHTFTVKGIPSIRIAAGGQGTDVHICPIDTFVTLLKGGL